MSNVKKVLFVMGMFLFLLFVLPAEFVQATNLGGGSCGEDAIWVLDANGVLTISGKGAVTSDPWDNYAENVRQVVIENGITSIPDEAFEYRTGYWDNYSNLVSVTMADSVTSLGYEAFSGCMNLSYVKLSESLTELQHGTFWGCSSLTSIVIPKSVKSIGTPSEGGVFGDCTSLTNVSLGNVTTIGFSAFAGCTSLSSITIPVTVDEIRNSAFAECTALSNIVFEDGANILNIDQSVFEGCTALETLVLPDRINEIGGFGTAYSYTFSRCSNLKKIIIGSGLSDIGLYAFNDCESLKEIYFCGDAPEFGSSYSDEVFRDVTATAYYPAKNSTWGATSLANHGGVLTWQQWDCPVSHSIVKNVYIDAVDKGLKVRWDKEYNVSGYYVYRKVNKGSWKKYKKVTGANTCKFLDKKVKNGAKYSYMIYPFRGKDLGKTYETAKKTYLKRPVIISAKKTSYGYLVKWKKNSKAKSYMIGYATYKSCNLGDTKYVKIRKNQRYFKLYTNNRRTYYFKVQARAYGINSTKSDGSAWSKVKKGK